ncbi:DJ-1/PfpI family protein [Euzebya sp.]|uniref:DJ-1/PfpI family protein n=1 Tax=Euzebya sp. TaxID=1971409 RepID=UPI0035148FD2
MATPPLTVGLLAFARMDLMDLVGPYEVLLTANRLSARRGHEAPFELVTIGPGPVRAYGGMTVTPDVTAADAPPLDVLVVPGAIDLDGSRPDPDLAALAPTTPVLASVCTGAFFLQRTGLLGDRPATTHWEDVPDLTALGVDVRDDVRWVDAGEVVTSGGIASGIAMALHLVERFCDRGLAEACAAQIDYVWTESR